MVVAVHQGRLGEDDLITLVPVLFAVAATGDAVARRLVARQAEEIAVMAVDRDAAARPAVAGVTVVLGGGAARVP